MFETDYIEKITQAVLRELNARGVELDRAPEGAGGAQSSDVFSGVVTQDVLEGAQAAGSIRLAVGAIITPSGHEYIRRNEITIDRSTVAVSVANSAGLVVCSEGSATVQAAAKSAGWSVQDVEDDNAIVSAVGGSVDRFVCCAEHPSLVACLLNRNENMRAAVVAASLDLMPLKEVMNPNVVCLNASGWSFTAFLRMLKTINQT